jgi:N-methylhydantoinase A
MHLYLAAIPSEEDKLEVGKAVNAAWEEMEKAALEEMKTEGRELGEVHFQHLAMIRYAAQLTDLEVESPVRRIETAADMDSLIQAWEALYEKINSRVSKYTEAGYSIFELGVLARVEKVKPRFQKKERGSSSPSPEAAKGSRKVFREGAWKDAALWEMDALTPGNVIEGLAIIEHPATTFVVPEGRRVEVDEWNILWLR